MNNFNNGFVRSLTIKGIHSVRVIVEIASLICL